MKRFWSITLVTVVLALSMVSADAQVRSREDVKIRARTQAALAYDSAVDLYGSGRYRDAGVMFLKADILEPSAAALLQAFKAYQRAGDKKMTELLDKQIRLRYSDKRLADELNREGIICVSKWELEIFRSRLNSGTEMLDDWINGKRLIKLQDNPYGR